MRTVRAMLGLLAALAQGCIGVEPRPLQPAPAIGLAAGDFAGEDAELDQLPRRPRLRLEHRDGFGDPQEAIFIFEGPADQQLVSDLERSPLSGGLLARRVACDLEAQAHALVVTPAAALAAGAEYTLAVAAWALDARGGELSSGGPALFALATAADAEAGARVVAALPADGASAVGTNLEAAVIAFDGAVHGAADGVWLEGPDGLAVPARVESGACAQLAPEYAAHSCVRLQPEQRLAPGASHALVVGAAAHDAHGAPVGPFRAAFRTATAADTQPPLALIVSCAVDEQPLEFGCALIDDHSIALRVHASEAVLARFTLAAVALRVAAPDGQLALHATGLPPDTAHALALSLRDSAGNTLELAAELRTQPALATVSISELYPDPLGPEPQQEFVELWNYGPRSVELLGFTLGDRADMLGAAIARAFQLAPQARVLLVPDTFDPNEARDPAPPPGALLLQVGKALGSGGLRNSGEALYLRDAQGRRVSASPEAPRPQPGVCLVRVSDDPRSGAPGSFAHAPDGRCTPGR